MLVRRAVIVTVAMRFFSVIVFAYAVSAFGFAVYVVIAMAPFWTAPVNAFCTAFCSLDMPARGVRGIPVEAYVPSAANIVIAISVPDALESGSCAIVVHAALPRKTSAVAAAVCQVLSSLAHCIVARFCIAQVSDSVLV